MNKIFFLLVATVFAVQGVQAGDRPVDFRTDLSYGGAKAEAKNAGRHVFIDFFTTWCGPCKTMDQEVFTDKAVVDFMNSKFINLKIDAEAGDGVALAKKYNVRAYPTFVVLNSDGSEAFRLEGANKAPLFLESLEKGLDKQRSPEALKSRFEKGERSPALINDYVLSIMQSGDEAAGFAVIGDYFESLTRDGKADPANAFLYERYSMNLADEKIVYYFANSSDFMKSHGQARVDRLTHRMLRAELITYANGYRIRTNRFDAAEYAKLLHLIQSVLLSDSLTLEPLAEIADARILAGIPDRPFVEACERVFPRLSQQDRFLLIHSFADYKGHPDPEVRQKAVNLINAHIHEFNASTIGVIRRLVQELEETPSITGVEFKKLTFDEALKVAKQQNKLIFLDAFTTWCGPCKVMDQQVFSRKDIGEFFNPNFINLKIDMEKGEGIELMKKYGIRAFPTFLLINSEGEAVHRLVGMYEPQPFMAAIRKGMQAEHSLLHLEGRYEKGDRTADLVRKYTDALAEASETRKVNQILASYFSSLTKESRFVPENSFAYRYSPTLAEERFRFLLLNADQFRTALGTDAFEEVLDQVCVPQLMNYQAEWRNPKLLQERFPALLDLQLSNNSETDALVGLIKHTAQEDRTPALRFLDQNIERFGDRNQLFALYQLLSIPVSGTDEQKAGLQQLLKRVILKNRNESIRDSLVSFLNRLEKSMV